MHVTRLLLPDFSVKVVRHTTWDSCCGRLWKKAVGCGGKPHPSSDASRGAAADDSPGRKSGVRPQTTEPSPEGDDREATTKSRTGNECGIPPLAKNAKDGAPGLLVAAATSVSRVNPNFHSGLRDYLFKGGVPPEPTTLIREHFPLKAGDKLSFDPGKGDVYEDDQLALEIAFNEPGIAEGEIVLSVLKQSRRLVQEIASYLMTLMY